MRRTGTWVQPLTEKTSSQVVERRDYGKLQNGFPFFYYEYD